LAPVWKTSNKTYIWLFNTGRGLSICIRPPNNIGLIYDLGCKDDFSPIDFIQEEIIPHLAKYKSTRNLGQLIVSHPHQDHIQEAEKVNESESFNIGLVTLPHDLDVEGQEDEKIDFDRIENDDNKEPNTMMEKGLILNLRKQLYPVNPRVVTTPVS
jgi:beta-lactamase superfamily II metal-dependent hydrolase